MQRRSTLSPVRAGGAAGKTPEEEQANLGTLTGLVVELEGQQTKVASGDQWTGPAAPRAGRAILTLRRPERRMARRCQSADSHPTVFLPRGFGQTDVALLIDFHLGGEVTIDAPPRRFVCAVRPSLSRWTVC